MRMYDIIMKKRNGGELTEEEILSLRQNNGSDMDVVKAPSRKYRRNMKKAHK